MVCSFGNTCTKNELIKNSIPRVGFAKDFELSDDFVAEEQ